MTNKADTAGGQMGTALLLAFSCVIALHPAAVQARAPCVGDCRADGRVTVDDLITGVNIALSVRPLTDCSAFDTDGNGRVAVNELVQGVRSAIDGCAVPSSSPTPTATTEPSLTPTSTATPTATEEATATLSATPTASSSPTPTATVTKPARPNVIVIDLDDTRADGIDRMPILQARLAGEGVTFRNSFVSDAVCAPSRASLFSGLYARHHGTQGVAGPIGGADTFRVGGADRHTIAVWMHDAGYRTGLFGKYLNDYATSEADKGPGGTFYVPPGWDRWRAMQSAEHYGGLHGPTYKLVDEGGQVTTYDDHTTDEQYSTDLLARELRDFIDDSVSAGRSFFAVWTPIASHGDVPGLSPIPAARHDGFFAGLPPWRPPGVLEIDVSDKPLWVQTRPVTAIIKAVSDVMRLRAYESLLAVDEELGLILDHLDALGVGDNTVVLFTSDNGVCWGEHHYYGQGKGCPYEECLRVPMILRYPRLVQQVPALVDAPVLNVDIAPTIAALAGVVVPGPVDGASFAPWLVGAQPPWRESFLIEYFNETRGDSLAYTGQVSDGDRFRLLYGDTRAQPRAEIVFEFDAGEGGAHSSTIVVPIGIDADASFRNLGAAVTANVPDTTSALFTAQHALSIADRSPSLNGVYWIVELDQGQVTAARQYPLPDWVGIRDVTNGYTYAEYATGEVELYDLAADPAELSNVADDPEYAAVRQQLEQTLVMQAEEE